MKESNEQSPSIHDHDVVERYVYAVNSNSGRIWVIHFDLQFIRFEKLVFELIDLGFVNIKEIELDELAKLSIAHHNTFFTLDSISKYDGFMKELPKRVVNL